MGVYVLIVFGNLNSADIVGIVGSILATVALYFTNQLIDKTLASSSTDELVGQKKKTVLITTFLNPIVSGAFYKHKENLTFSKWGSTK